MSTSRSLSLFVLVALSSLALAACSSPEEKAQNYYERGNEYLAKKDYVKAGLEFKNALQLNKNMVAAWRGLLEVETHSSNLQSVVPTLRNIVELAPKDVKAKLQLGRIFLAGNALDQALDLANAATKLEPNNADVIAFHAGVLLKLDDQVAAKREAEKALHLDPKNTAAWVVLAAEKMKRGDLKGALAILDQQADANEKDLGLQISRLNLMDKLGQSKETEQLLRKLIEMYPKIVNFRQALVNFYIDKKRFDDAEKELRAISSANPSDVNAGLNLVRFLQQHKGAAAARQELVALSKKADAAPFKYQIALAEFEYSQGQADESIKLLEKLSSGDHAKEQIITAKLALAEIYLKQKKHDAAKLLISEVLSKDEQNTEGLKLRASLRLAEGNVDAAITDLRQALNDQPRATDLMLLLASAYERGGSIDLAEKQFANATQVSNFNPAVALNYVAFLQRRGNFEHAEDILVDLARRWPNNIPVLTALAQVRLARHNWNGAKLVADAIQKIKGNQNLGDEIYAASLLGEGKYENSIRLLESVHASVPAAVQPMVALVNTMVRANQLDKANIFLQKVLKENPKNAVALILLGSIQERKKADEEAIKDYRAAIEIEPKKPDGYFALAALYLRQKKLVESEKSARDGLKQIPDNLALHQMLASALELQGRYDQAIAEYEYILKQQPGSLVAANNLASLLSDRRGDKESLERAYSVAVVLRKSPIPSFKDTLGWIYFLRGDTKSALPLLEDAAKSLKDRAVVQYHLGMCYQATGDSAKATEQFAKALKLQPDAQLAAKIQAASEKTRM